MNPDRWRKIQDLFAEACAQQPPERAAFLEKACAGDDDLRREVEWMLAHQGDAERFIPKPALDVAAASLAASRVATLAGSSLGQYQDLQLIGAGGMGQVFRGVDTRLNRPVAIKVLTALTGE